MTKVSPRNSNQNYWFRRKLYGWGWVPARWQGWVTLLIWLIVYSFSMMILDHEWMKNVLVVVAETSVLLYVCFKKGEKPRWQWGKRL